MLSDVITPDLFAAALRIATPLALAAIGGTICERSGIVNIALEGIMLVGAFFGTATVLATGSPWLGVLVALVSGVAISAVHAVASVNLRADQVVSGTAINLLALGLTGFLMELWYGHPGTTQPIETLPPVFSFGAMGEGFIGEVWRWINGVFLSHTPLVYLAIAIALVAQWAMYHTRWGLRLRGLGEHPRAVDTAGVSVARGRWVAVLMSGALGGLAGANLSIEQVGVFQEGFTNGRGYIALAANIFGRWTPVGSYLASLLFGFADALQIKLQPFRDVIDLPPEFFLMVPYVVTVVVLAGVIGRAVGPAAVGVPYKKG
ncbi:ABC transporter permease [Anaerosoma tenue]|uniref:ABC transporter permease n=1 Tax=Anaerosoma tenue TaxID=2933588 RepID=UPI002260A68C|nr:ABC transporter permease [Anaerosoma tenue]MCK8114380.1 ABC transporter permease [Anaerosoma tenue]